MGWWAWKRASKSRATDPDTEGRIECSRSGTCSNSKRTHEFASSIVPGAGEKNAAENRWLGGRGSFQEEESSTGRRSGPWTKAFVAQCGL